MKIEVRNEFSLVPRASSGLAGLCALALFVSGCGDESAESGGPGDTEGPLYAVSHSVFTDDGNTSYVTVVDSLEPGPAVDLGLSLELGGSARAYGPEGSGIVYVTSSERGTMTEIAFGSDGLPSPGRSVSFENLGIDSTSGGNVHLFLSPTKAYFVSQISLEVVVWNPAAMEITTTIPLELDDHLVPDGFFYFYPRPIVVGDELVLLANQADAEDFDVPPVVTVVNTQTDQVVATTVEPRCQAMLQSAVDARGDRYFASSGLSAAKYFLQPDLAPAPCTLRMQAGETSFDPSWSRTLTEDLETRLWTGVTPGREGRMYQQSIEEEAASVVEAAESVDAYAVSAARPWRWHSQDSGDGEIASIESDFLSTPPLFAAFTVDGAQYVSVWDEVETTLVDLTSSNAPQEGLVAPGFVWNVVRIR